MSVLIVNAPHLSNWRIVECRSGTVTRPRVRRAATAPYTFASKPAAKKAGVPLDRHGWVKRKWVQAHYQELPPP